jgi:hypothetical protein
MTFDGLPVLSRRQVLAGTAGVAGLFAAGGLMDDGERVASASVPLARRCAFGAFAPNEPHGSAPAGLGEHYSLEARLGVRLKRMVWFANMDEPWPEAAAAEAAKTGHTPHFAWDSGRVRLSEILDGSRDAMLDAFFQRAKSFRRPVVLRLWWEMNTSGGRYTMAYRGPDKTVATVSEYKDAWRYVHRRAKVVNGAANVGFLFCANGSDVGGYPMEKYFPGAEFVDEIGFNSYNETTHSHWQSFEQKLRPMYDRVATLHPTAPVTIGELGTVNHGGPPGTSKATWLQDMFASTAFPRLTHVDFFSADQGPARDWRLTQTREAIAVCRTNLARAPQG